MIRYVLAGLPMALFILVAVFADGARAAPLRDIVPSQTAVVCSAAATTSDAGRDLAAAQRRVRIG